MKGCIYCNQEFPDKEEYCPLCGELLEDIRELSYID